MVILKRSLRFIILPAMCCVWWTSVPSLVTAASTLGPIVVNILFLRSRVRYRTSGRYLSKPSGNFWTLVPLILIVSSWVKRPANASGRILSKLDPVMTSSLSFVPKALCTWWDKVDSSILMVTFCIAGAWESRSWRRNERTDA